MLRVTIAIHSSVTGNVGTLRTIDITNDGKGNERIGQYDIALTNFERDGSMILSRVENYERDQDVLDLVQKAIASLMY